MQKDPASLLQHIRTKNSESSDSLIFEIDLSDSRITTVEILDEGNPDLHSLGDRLPSSYLKFLKTYSNGIHMEIGNALTIFPLDSNEEFAWSLQSITSEMHKNGSLNSDNFLVFGMSGVDGDAFAFYTGIKFTNGEYPIVWFSPGSSDTNRFVLLNSGFDKFLTMQYYLLRATDFEDAFETWEEAEKVSSDLVYLAEEERRVQDFRDLLYNIFDPIIPKPNHDYWKSATSMSEIIEILEQIRNINR